MPISQLSWHTVYVHINVPHDVSLVEGKIMYNTSVAKGYLFGSYRANMWGKWGVYIGTQVGSFSF